MTSHNPILVADNDKTEVFLLRRAFGKAGLTHILLEVSDGQEAIDYLKGVAQFQNRFLYPLPSLLLLDLEMPGMDGFAVLGWLLTRSDLEALPVVVLSSSNQEPDIKRAKALGADDYVVKPADFDGMRSMAKDLVAHWLA
jgi:two-component system response regulator